jgi:hypothetical protein
VISVLAPNAMEAGSRDRRLIAISESYIADI